MSFFISILFLLQSQQIIDNRYKVAYEYIINSKETKCEIIPFIDDNASKLEYPLPIEVSPELKGLFLSNFISLYKWMYPKLDNKASLDSIATLSLVEESKPKLDSTCIQLINLSKGVNGKYIIFFSVIENDKLTAELYPISMGHKDYKTVSRFARGCEFLFFFNANGTLKAVHYTLMNID